MDEFLLDEVSSDDAFKNKNHTAIAERIYNIIKSNNGRGFPIGLIGEWGSGKSTIVKLLQKNYLENDDNEKNKNNKIFVYYIDSWVHEGDCLRRVFLEKLIEKIEDDFRGRSGKIKRLDELKNKISNQTTKTTTNHSITKIGAFFAFFAALIPFAVAFFEKVLADIGTIWKVPFYWYFAFAIGFFVLVAAGVFSSLTGDAESKGIGLVDENTDEFSQTGDRTSIEFEKYFYEILKFLGKKKITKFVCIIDNLDRVNREYALEIWSTLQVFLRDKNPRSKREEKIDEEIPKIWTLMPFAESAMKKMWKLDDSKNGDEDDLARHFFDKFFLLRIDVPQLPLSEWQDFAEKNLTDCFEEKEKREIVLNVLRWTRNGVSDSPTPREIKTYINQVYYLSRSVEEGISLEAICYFVYLRYLAAMSIEAIKKQLVEKKIPDGKMNFCENKEGLGDELAAILFGSNVEDAVFLLLSSPIEDALKKGKPKKIELLAELHGKDFFDVLDEILKNENPLALDYILCLKGANLVSVRLKKSLSRFAVTNKVALKKEIFDISPEDVVVVLGTFLEEDKAAKKELVRKYVKEFSKNLALDDLTEEKYKGLFEIEKIFDGEPPCRLSYEEIGFQGVVHIAAYNASHESESLHVEKYLNVPKKADEDLYEELMLDNPFANVDMVARILALASDFVFEESMQIINDGDFTDSSKANTYLKCLFELAVRKLEKENLFIFTKEYWNVVRESGSRDRKLEAACLYIMNYGSSESQGAFWDCVLFAEIWDILEGKSRADAEFIYKRLVETNNLDALLEIKNDEKLELGKVIANIASKEGRLKIVGNGKHREWVLMED